MKKKDKDGLGYKEWTMQLDTLFIKVMKEMVDQVFLCFSEMAFTILAMKMEVCKCIN
ncbi:hypothetical protein LINPERPRIM_LOCUS20215, partial [Linum perenne]